MTADEMDRYKDPYFVEHGFGDALSYIPIHNHLNGAYHRADIYWMAPPHDLMWRIPSLVVPAKVRDLIDADTISSEALHRIARTQQIIADERSALDRDIARLIHHTPDRPNRVHDSVVLTHQVREGYAPAWRYEFNPYQLAMTLLDGFEQFINTTMQRRIAPFTQLSRICMEAKRIRDSAELVRSELSFNTIRR
ncbi:MAG: hypothetical protein WAQ27_02670 [Candidatus Microsaccharimonas sp.]